MDKSRGIILFCARCGQTVTSTNLEVKVLSLHIFVEKTKCSNGNSSLYHNQENISEVISLDFLGSHVLMLSNCTHQS